MTETRQESLVDKSVNNQHGMVSWNCNCNSTLRFLILEVVVEREVWDWTQKPPQKKWLKKKRSFQKCDKARRRTRIQHWFWSHQEKGDYVKWCRKEKNKQILARKLRWKVIIRDFDQNSWGWWREYHYILAHTDNTSQASGVGHCVKQNIGLDGPLVWPSSAVLNFSEVKGAETRLDTLGWKWNTGNLISACRQYKQCVQI